jgi:hypothetical protein
LLLYYLFKLAFLAHLQRAPANGTPQKKTAKNAAFHDSIMRKLTIIQIGERPLDRHCEERRNAAIQRPQNEQDLDCFVARASRNDG